MSSKVPSGSDRSVTSSQTGSAETRPPDPERTVVRTGNDTPPPFGALGWFVVPGYHVLGEIARGGMGVV
ncbi:MAG TPA: hypothetical protein VH092_33880, partial [Urbifossiella sp.]|nr:hypothetical protein [Urbifossiella sp.]